MKKFLAILFFMVYGLSSSGMTLYFHYCCGQLEKVDITPVEKKGCNKCHGEPTPANETEKPCCENKAVDVKVNSDQKVHHQEFKPFKAFPEKSGQLQLKADPLFCRGKISFAFKSSQYLFSPPLFILNGVFRI